MLGVLWFGIVTSWVTYTALRRRGEAGALSDIACVGGAVGGHGYRPSRALLILAVVGITCGFCFNATAVPDRCPIDGGRLTEHPADPAHGYWWPYLLVTPAPLAAGAPRPLGARTLLVAPNNTEKPDEDIGSMTAKATCALTYSGDINALELADSLGTPVLVPLFPQPPNLYLQALTRASLKQKAEPSLKHVDLQLIAMIDAARAELAAKGQPVQSRVLIAGFSAAGMFTNRFTMLHPKRVLAAAVGLPGGWPIAPV